MVENIKWAANVAMKHAPPTTHAIVARNSSHLTRSTTKLATTARGVYALFVVNALAPHMIPDAMTPTKKSKSKRRCTVKMGVIVRNVAGA